MDNSTNNNSSDTDLFEIFNINIQNFIKNQNIDLKYLFKMTSNNNKKNEFFNNCLSNYYDFLNSYTYIKLQKQIIIINTIKILYKMILKHIIF